MYSADDNEASGANAPDPNWDPQMAEMALIMGHDANGSQSGIERSLVPILIYDTETLAFLAANAAALRLYGYSEAELMRLSILDIRPPEEIPRLQAFLSMGWPSGVRHAGIWLHITKNGRVFKARTIGMNTAFSGLPARVMLIEELTPNTYAADSVAQLLFPFAEQMEDAAWIRLLRSGRYAYLNPAFEKIVGLKREQVYADPEAPDRLVHAEDVDACERSRLEQAAGPVEMEYRLCHPDGTLRWLLVRSFLIRDAVGEMMCAGITKDITLRKLVEQQRIARVDAQREAMVREVHHHVKNSLQGVTGLLRQFANAHPETAAVLAQVSSVVRSVAFAHGLQAYPSGGEGELPELVAGIVSSLEVLTGETIELSVEVQGDIHLVLDERQAVPVALALNELVFNAVKHKVGKGVARIVLKVDAAACRAEFCVSNPGRLSAGFPGKAAGIGLKLVTALLVEPGAALDWQQQNGRVVVRLVLEAPLLIRGPASKPMSRATPRAGRDTR